MTFSQLRYFIALAECLNYTEAARRLFISQPSLSKQIANIEQELDVQLFVRDRKSTSLTPAGRKFYEGSRKLLADYHTLLLETQSIQRSMPSELHIGVLEFQQFGQEMVRLRELLEESFSDVEVRAVPAGYRALLDGLMSGQFDFIITTDFELADRPDLRCRSLRKLDNALVLPKTHPLAARRNLTLADFSNETFLTVSDEETPQLTRMIAASCRAAGFEPKLRVTDTYSSLMAMLEMGQGIIALNTEHYLYTHPGLRFAAVPEIGPIDMMLAWNPNNRNPLIPILLEVFEREKYETISL